MAMKIVQMGRMKMIDIVPFEDASWDFSNAPIINVFWTISNVMGKMNVEIIGKKFMPQNALKSAKKVQKIRKINFHKKKICNKNSIF